MPFIFTCHVCITAWLAGLYWSVDVCVYCGNISKLDVFLSSKFDNYKLPPKVGKMYSISQIYKFFFKQYKIYQHLRLKFNFNFKSKPNFSYYSKSNPTSTHVYSNLFFKWYFQGLYAYRKELIKLNAEHINFQSELTKWRNNFRSEQINFLLLFGVKRISVFSIGILITLLIIGKTANFILFAVLFMYFVIKSEETNSKKYMAAIGIGVLAMFIEVQRQNGLIAFNGLSSMILCLCYLGFMDF